MRWTQSAVWSIVSYTKQNPLLRHKISKNIQITPRAQIYQKETIPDDSDKEFLSCHIVVTRKKHMPKQINSSSIKKGKYRELFRTSSYLEYGYHKHLGMLQRP